MECFGCGQEVQLQVDGRPVCPLCDSDHARPETVDALWGNAKSTKSEHRKLSDQRDAFNPEIVAGTHGIPYPDSVHRVEALGGRARVASERYQRAMKAYREALKPDALLEKARLTKAECIGLTNRFDTLNREVASGIYAISHPDSVRQLEVLASRIREAFQQYQLAMEEYERSLERS